MKLEITTVNGVRQSNMDLETAIKSVLDQPSTFGCYHYSSEECCCYNSNHSKQLLLDQLGKIVQDLKYLESDIFLFKNQQTTFGRYVRRQLRISSYSISDSYLSRFVYSLLSKLDCVKDEDIKFLKGKQITEFYQKTDITSCMTGRCAFYTELYALNPKKVSLLVYYKNNKPVARALFWTINGKKYIDRIYSKDERYSIALSDWAEKNKYPSLYITKSFPIHVRLNAKTFIPYLDSFPYSYHIKQNNKQILISMTHINFGDRPYKSIDFSAPCNSFTNWTEKKSCDVCGEIVAVCKEFLLLDQKGDECYICMSCQDEGIGEYIFECIHCGNLFANLENLDKDKDEYEDEDEYVEEEDIEDEDDPEVDCASITPKACHKCLKKHYKFSKKDNIYTLKTKKV